MKGFWKNSFPCWHHLMGFSLLFWNAAGKSDRPPCPVSQRRWDHPGLCPRPQARRHQGSLWCHHRDPSNMLRGLHHAFCHQALRSRQLSWKLLRLSTLWLQWPRLLFLPTERFRLPIILQPDDVKHCGGGGRLGIEEAEIGHCGGWGHTARGWLASSFRGSHDWLAYQTCFGVVKGPLLITLVTGGSRWSGSLCVCLVRRDMMTKR